MKSKRLILFVTLISINVLSLGQELSRLGSIGLGFIPLNDSIAKLNGIEKSKGLYVTKVLPGLTGEELGIKQGDIVLNINGISDIVLSGINVNKEFTKLAGEEVTYTILRNGKTITTTAKAIPRPLETSSEFNILYDQFPFESGRIRCIISSPKSLGKKPGILLIQGLGCNSIDNPSPFSPTKRLADELTRRGYIVLRSEKPGVGDCDNTPNCYDSDFRTEVSAFRNAYLKLKTVADVDTNNLFIIGHSMGGMETPFIASEVKPKGVIVYGVTTKSWYEYLIEMLRYQNPNMGIPYDDVQKEMNLYYKLLYEIFINMKRPSELIAENPAYRSLLQRDFNYIKGDDFLTKNVSFSQSLNNEDVVAEWGKVSCFVLSAFGEYDIQAVNNFGQKEIVDIVNKNTPGKADYIEFPKTEHGMIELQNEQEKWDFYIKPGESKKILSRGLSTVVLDSIDSWIKRTVEK